MTTQEYLKEILKQQSLPSDSDEVEALRFERNKVDGLIRESFKESSITIQYAGSYAKKTMIRDSYDLDIACYFNHDDELPGKTLEEIFNSVKESLESGYYVVPKKSAIRLQSSDINPQGIRIDFHIDVVPGRFTDDGKEEAFLYQSSRDKKRLKTNLKKHIEYIKESGLVNTIKLVKFWKKRIGLSNIKTFILELLVIESLGKLKDSNGLDECLKKFWEQLRDNIKNLKIEDPANPTGNDLSDLFDESTKTALSAFATSALTFIDNDNWESIFGKVESMSDDEKVASVGAAILLNPNRPKLWCDIT